VQISGVLSVSQVSLNKISYVLYCNDGSYVFENAVSAVLSLFSIRGQF